MVLPSSSVMVDRKYFKELMRRANCISSNVNGSERAFETAVLIPRDEYEGLRSVVRQLANLRMNLIKGGLDEDTLNALSADDELHQEPSPPESQPPTHQPYQGSPPGRADGGYYRGQYRGQDDRPSPRAAEFQPRSSYSDERQTPSNLHDFGGPFGDNGKEDHTSQSAFDFDDSRSQNEDSPAFVTKVEDDYTSPHSVPDRTCLRTIQLVGLPESATLDDVEAAVRGGPLLELYIRAHDRSAFVSFIREPDAKEFFEHVRKNDLYIKMKRIEARWSERQFVLLSHVGSQINAGATRNFVIRQCDPRITEELIRQHLDHIHNLVIISVRFSSGNCYINANSVHNAMFARSALMSRATYRGSRIDWMPDECAQAIEHVVPVQRLKKKPMPTVKKQPGFGVPNRFQLLNLGDEDGDSGNGAEGDENSN